MTPLPSTNKRTEFGTIGCIVYGYPSSGGVLVKEADMVDMLFLSLNRLHPSHRSSDAVEEDQFCTLMRRVGATWWESEDDWGHAVIGMRDKTAEESRITVFGWPADGGVWVLRYASEMEVPRDFGRLRMAANMEERVLVMREYGAVYYRDVQEVEELREL